MRPPNVNLHEMYRQDTAGQERFSSLSAAFFRGADAALLMFDVNRPETLDGLNKWWDEFKVRAPVPDEEAEDYCCVVVGNKVDLAEDEGGIGFGNGNGRGGQTQVTEVEAESFLEELIPRATPVPPTSPYDQDPGSARWASIHENGSAYSDSAEGEDDELADSPQRTQSINIQNGHTQHPYAKRNKRASKSRSSERSFYGGTMTTTRTTLSIYHTPSSSFFDSYESALSSPGLPSGNDSVIQLSSPLTSPRGSIRISRRMTNASASSSSSAPTITPSLFTRRRASPTDVTTPPTPPALEHSNSQGVSLNEIHSPPHPERRPKLFLTSAKTGAGVANVFEYIAKRVVMKWEYEEAIEARTLHVRDGTMTSGVIQLDQPTKRSKLGNWMNGWSCCQS